MEATAIQSVEKNITMVALANVQPSNYNPRKNFDEASLAELSESIRQQGVLQPIGVRPIEDNRFEIVFGHFANLAKRGYFFCPVKKSHILILFYCCFRNGCFRNGCFVTAKIMQISGKTGN